MSNLSSPLKAGDPITIEPVNFYRLKTKLLECALLEERANAMLQQATNMVRQAATQRRAAMVEAVLDPVKSYQLEDHADGLCTATEIVPPPAGGQ